MKTEKEIKKEIRRVQKLIDKDHSDSANYGKGRRNGLMWALEIKTNCDGDAIE